LLLLQSTNGQTTRRPKEKIKHRENQNKRGKVKGKPVKAVALKMNECQRQG